MARLPRYAIEALAREHFGDRGEVVVQSMVAIAFAESSGDTDAIGDNVASGHQSPGSAARWDDGLWQINSVHGFSRSRVRLYPDYCAKVARIIYNRQGLRAWTTYTGGQYRRYYLGPQPLSPKLSFQRAVLIAYDAFFNMVIRGKTSRMTPLLREQGKDRYLLEIDS